MSDVRSSGPVSNFRHGPRLGDDEYERRVVRLHEGLPPIPSREQDREVRRAELDLAIDHRLGRDFPLDRRRALWEVMEEVDRRRLRLLGRDLLTRVFTRRRGPVRSAQGLAAAMVDRCAEVLDERELESFFGQEWRTPSLPVDFEHRPARHDAKPG